MENRGIFSRIIEIAVSAIICLVLCVASVYCVIFIAHAMELCTGGVR